jgi:hypothetical protein
MTGLKLRVVPQFPSRVIGGAGVDVSKQNGNFTFALNYNDFPTVTAIPPTPQYALAFDPVTNKYVQCPLSIFGGGGGIVDGPHDGFTYGRNMGNWVQVLDPALGGTVTGNVTFNGTVNVPSPTASSQAATKGYVDSVAAGGVMPATAIPLMDGVAAVGVSVKYAREDHVHPSDTSRAPLASPAFTGTPTAPTPAANDNSTKVATTAFVVGQVATAAPLMDSAAAVGVSLLYARQDHVHPSDTSKLSDAPGSIANDGNQYARQNGGWVIVTGGGGGIPEVPNDGAIYGRGGVSPAWQKVLPLSGGTVTGNVTFSGTVTVPTPTVAGQAATKGYADSLVVSPATVAPLMDGAAAVGTSLLYARQDHIHPSDTTRAPLASPALTGTPTAPTATAGTNTTQIATTAFVLANAGAGAVRYDIAQGLTAGQQTQGRANLGLGSNSLPSHCFMISSTQNWTCPRSGRYLVKALAGGGGGGGYGGSGAVGAGGGAGGDCWSELGFVAGDIVGCTVGAAGVGGAPTGGGSGGAGGVTIVQTVSGTSFTTMTANPGGGGTGTTGTGGATGGTGGNSSGGNLVNNSGADGYHGFSMAAGQSLPGAGAGTRWGSGGRPGGELVGASGGAAKSFGAGGGGGLEAGGGGGGGGAPGLVEIYLLEGA